MTVRLSEALSEVVAANVSETGAYENISEYIRDLIRRDKERVKREAFDRLKTELQHAFAAPDASYHLLSSPSCTSACIELNAFARHLDYDVVQLAAAVIAAALAMFAL